MYSFIHFRFTNKARTQSSNEIPHKESYDFQSNLYSAPREKLTPHKELYHIALRKMFLEGAHSVSSSAWWKTRICVRLGGVADEKQELGVCHRLTGTGQPNPHQACCRKHSAWPALATQGNLRELDADRELPDLTWVGSIWRAGMNWTSKEVR